ncbi:MAG: UDP-glucose 6-dehydrogenase [Candidatus Giovannonibacteria bacterium GW2011_GWC2_44_9]|uniref:UDP-glucose 6-dehydrogenase n=3 Tax=Candidatus Giovannoniibacteriota TaxID=1752738 RepID=A0A0G1L6R1_9BACT|nr:MAG: UDP-glucose 6-dehydrogenase [Candidatus Giovannonibacteria bacterium GW2011_GWB1_44_23]KKT64337.1 MAG: UDP-glucose 6-dehydrogenase [Candidatus Giovannonibacteria bacterium GW2011_GWA1_44_29]KKT84291.1 MAG: UDP-glucose 6-dehydrogenase [Candidatus Giovannonibacteria bacterium GW2011_GWC2_44_9]KKT92064.1 MAG: UDP-glucose 6-dehydrogenase [Parcubacteria group bacterium GW2011_GWC1_45_13]
MFNAANQKYAIGILGLWHLGSVYSACLAELGHDVIGYDRDANTVSLLNSGEPPVHESGLPELIKKNMLSGRLAYTNNLDDLKKRNVFWFTIDTEIDRNDMPDISNIKQMITDAASYFKKETALIFSSQLPVGSSAELKALVSSLRPGLNFGYAYQPENLQLGKALENFLKPARIIVGTDAQNMKLIVENIFSPLGAPIETISIPSAEMAKHALNAFLATSLSFIYDIADVCEKYGANVLEVTKALKSDSRIGGAAYLDASIGFSGGTLGRDLAVLLDKAKAKKIKLPVIFGAVTKNKERWRLLADFLKGEIKNLSQATIGVLGMTYKPGTSTLRHSLSVQVVRDLAPMVKEIRCHDPLANKEEVMATAKCIFYDDPYKMVEGSSALIVMTGCSEYRDLDFKKMAPIMKEPKIFFDAKNIFWEREQEIRKAGFHYQGIGISKNL